MLGAVLDLSGVYSEEGIASKACLELAVQDLNRMYLLAGSQTRFACTFSDSKMDTILAMKAVESFYSHGIRLLAGGPNTSSELRAIKTYIDSHSMIDLNCFSTTPSLAIAGDYIFRLIADDNAQGQALVRMMQFDSIEALVPVWNNDTYGQGLTQTIRKKFTAAGKTVTPGVEYHPASVSYTEVMSKVTIQARQAASKYGKSKVGILLVSFQDAADFFDAASVSPGLDSMRWYGCDANSQKTTVISDSVAGRFAEKVRFLAPVMSIGTATSVPAPAQALAERVFAATGLHPDDMALSAYDAVMIYGQCINLTGRVDAAAVKTILPGICKSYNYLGLNRSLNEAGDLTASNFIFWTVKSIAGSRVWDSYATWYCADDRIILKP